MNYMEAGNRIRKLREKSHMSREKFSEKANISPKFLYEIETGQKKFSADTLFKISKVLKVSSEYILSGYSANENDELNAILSNYSPEQLKDVIVILKTVYKISLMWGKNTKNESGQGGEHFNNYQKVALFRIKIYFFGKVYPM